MKKLVVFAAMVLLILSAAHAQVTTGTISGTITDATGAVLPGATVTILNEGTGITRTTVTDAGGRYLAPSLNLGNYRVSITQPGFQTEVRTGIELTIGRNALVDVQMNVGAVTQTVEVSGEAPLVETQQSSVSYLVNENTINQLPLNGRDITQLIFLQPGVNVAENSASGNAYVGFGKKFSVGGMRGEDNAYLLDGGYLNNMNRQLPSGPSGALLGSETVKEFNVLTNSYSAQFGRALGGIFNAVSKSGTNEWNGDIYEYTRNSALDARNFFDRQQSPTDPKKPSFVRNSFGGTIGGPIQRDKAFFFAAYEGMRESKTTTEYRTVPDADARRGVMPALTAAECTGVSGVMQNGRCSFAVSPTSAHFLQLFPAASPLGANNGDGTAQYIFAGDNTAQDDYGQVRVDYQLSDNDNIFARVTASNAHKTIPESYPEFRTTQVMNTRLGTVSETRIFSPTFLNTLRIHINRIDPQDRGQYPSVDPTFTSNPSTTIPAAVAIGNGVNQPEGAPKPIDRWVTNRYSLQEDVNWSLGAHSLQFGGLVERMQFNMITPNRPYGLWTWTNLEDFLFGKNATSYRGTPDGIPVTINGKIQPSDTIRAFRQTFYALYLQDDWSVTPRLTLNLGLRWEPYSVANEVNGKVANLRHLLDAQETIGDPYWKNHTLSDWGPRIGFAWSPFGSSTSVRGGIGLFYVPNDPQVYRSQANRNAFFPEFQFNLPQDTATTPAPCHPFPSALAAIACVAASNAPEAIPFENQRSPHAVQYNFTVQRQLGQSSVVSVGYTGARGLDATAYVQTNMPVLTFDGVSYAIPAGATRPNPVFSDIKYYTNSTDSWYHGMLVSVQRRFTRGLQAQVSYTWSKALSTADTTSKTDSSGGGASPKYAWDMEANKGYSGYHLPNVLSANYVYDLPFGQGSSGLKEIALSGWQLSGIFSAQSGQPFSVSATAPAALSNLGLTRSPNLNNSFTRDEIVGGKMGDCASSVYTPGIELGGPDHYFNPCAFNFPSATEIGNVTKSFLIGPGMVTWDFSLTKNTKVTEGSQLQFRGEFFNVLNRPNFGKPSANLFNGSGTRSATAGQILSTTTTSRQIQFGLKYIF